MYVPTASDPAVTVAKTPVGVPQKLPQLGVVTANQLPPVEVDEVTKKLKAVPVLATVKVWGNGFAPPYGMVKAIGLIGANCCARPTLGNTTRKPNGIRTDGTSHRVFPANFPKRDLPPRTDSITPVLRKTVCQIVLRFLCSDSHETIYFALRDRSEKLSWVLKDLFFFLLVAGQRRLEVSPEPEQRRLIDSLYSVAYDELRRLAATIGRFDPSQTLNPTALVHETWLKLANFPDAVSISRLHFKRIAARAMRQVLVESARRRKSSKRGGGEFTVIHLDRLLDEPGAAGQELLSLESALKELEVLDPRRAGLIEGRFFGGLDFAEMAELFAVSEITVHRELRAAKAWLKLRVQRGARNE